MKKYRLLHLPTSKFVTVDESFADYKIQLNLDGFPNVTVESYIEYVNYGLEGLWFTNIPEENFVPLEFTNKRHFELLLRNARKQAVALFYCIGLDLHLVDPAITLAGDTSKIKMCKDEFDIVEVKP